LRRCYYISAEFQRTNSVSAFETGRCLLALRPLLAFYMTFSGDIIRRTKNRRKIRGIYSFLSYKWYAWCTKSFYNINTNTG